ncbi:MAG: FAD-dependent oxidoreductase [Anaerolineae bacterium]|nr:FAD-dependent oxidoreductase [Anaerolineae bacterium]
MNNRCFILGAGMTGLAAGLTANLPIYEAVDAPGGICSSYYVRPNMPQRLADCPDDGEVYRFEIGGGHWIFGGDPAILHFIKSTTPIKSYKRHSSVYFADDDVYVPYPLQNHLRYMGDTVAAQVLHEIVTAPKNIPTTMAEWQLQSFGPTLTEKFFEPFHGLYTAGLHTRIAPQDAYKSPINISQVLRGTFNEAAPVGYNVTFVYPQAGLNTLAQEMARRCDIRYGKQVTHIDPHRHEVAFADGTMQPYEHLISTLPLNKMLEMTGLAVDAEPDPYTSVLVLNIGATKGPKCPTEHWLYNPDAKSGFHRVGFYSNVDTSFLPQSSQAANDRVSIYVERTYIGGQKPSTQEIQIYADAVVRELQQWQFIAQPEVVDPTWIEVAYTWAWPGSTWKAAALRRLEEHHIFQVGRYGRWLFQGIADSIRDGFMVGAAFK